METFAELRASIERTLRDKAAVRAAWPDLDMEAMRLRRCGGRRSPRGSCSTRAMRPSAAASRSCRN